MDDERLKAIAARVEAAAPGPWETDGGQVVETVHTFPISGAADDEESAMDVCEVLHYGQGGSGTVNFIAAARTDVPDLLAHVEAIEAARIAERDLLLRWLIEARRTLYRTGGEEGMNDDEMSGALTSVLANYGCDDGTDETQAAEAARIMALPVRYFFESAAKP